MLRLNSFIHLPNSAFFSHLPLPSTNWDNFQNSMTPGFQVSKFLFLVLGRRIGKNFAPGGAEEEEEKAGVGGKESEG